MPQGKMPQVSDMSNTLMIQPEYREQFLMELREILPQARCLEACISLEVGEVTDQPGMFVLSERWRNGNEYLNEDPATALLPAVPGTQRTILRSSASSSRPHINLNGWLCPERSPNNAADGFKPLALRSSFFVSADLSRWAFWVM
jgi:quinol monooxygenase YgiN